MLDTEYTDEKLSLFIDEQLDTGEMDAVHEQLLSDKALRQRVCQLRAVRELVSYAYESMPAPDYERPDKPAITSNSWMGIAASMLLIIGMFGGWVANNTYHENTLIASTDEVFQFYKQSPAVESTERKIILHVTTGDIYAVNNALNEAEQLLASYRQAGTPMKLDIITFKEGINMLRVGVSPYIGRIGQIMSDNENVSIYACQRSISKAKKKEGRDIVLMPQAVTAKTGQQLITERLEKGWIYIKV
jgi:intracellular sulfur oxidation DsrE/DsrF family protein